MKKCDVVAAILKNEVHEPQTQSATSFAPTNIALCKYWGKRNTELNLPMTSSLSVALPNKGAHVTLTLARSDTIILNGEQISQETNFAKRLTDFLNLFRPAKTWHVTIEIQMNIPVAAGLASSACGFASIVMALKKLFAWKISDSHLSILARLGSGSAARSLWPGFVEWHAGVHADGMDSFAQPLAFEWPELVMGLLILQDAPKPLSSREAMQRTVDTSVLYTAWPKKVSRDLVILRQALHNKNFALLGGAAESNALAMHATMMSSWPPICYALPETILAMKKVWHMREQGLPVYFTQDAGPNLKLLFVESALSTIQEHFPHLEICRLFNEESVT